MTVSESIQPSLVNPRYWQYKGKPIRLLGGSVEDNLFQIDGLQAHLDLLVSSGGNYLRCTMSSRDEGDLWPYALEPDSGLYDLNQPNSHYWQRFTKFLTWTFERDILVQIECWDRFDFCREPWQMNPFNPKNNVNYTSDETGLSFEYPDHPNLNKQPFFYTIPERNNNTVLLAHQHAFMEKMLSISLSFPNVLYCMDNETSGAAEWGAYWAKFIRTKASAAGHQVFMTEMWDQWDIKGSMHEATFGHPEIYAFVDISQNNHISAEAHWTNIQARWLEIASKPRPMNMVKIYGADGNKFGHTDDEAIARFWRGLLGGMASLRFHRPPSGLGLGTKAQTSLRSARMLLDAWDWINSTPDSNHRFLDQRAEDGAYLSFITAKQYVLYFPRASRVRLDVRPVPSSLTLQWLNVHDSTWESQTRVPGGGWLELEPPADGHWVAFLQTE